MFGEAKIKHDIMARLKSAPGYPANCWHCGKYAATFTSPRRILHFDCWRYLVWKSRQEPQKSA